MEASITEGPSQTEVVRINRVAVSLLAVTAGVIGLAPTLLILRNPYWLLYVAGAGILLAFFYCIRQRSAEQQTVRATNAPSFSEFLLAAIGGVFGFTLVAFLWLGSHALLHGLLGAVQYFTGWPTTSANSISFYVTLVIFSLLAITNLFESINKIIAQLYPNAAGLQSAFYQVVALRRRRLAKYFIFATLLLVIPTAYFLVKKGTMPLGFLLYLQVVLLFFSSGPYNAKTQSESESLDGAIAIGRLLESLGYEAFVLPRFGDPEIDPILVELDVLACRDERAIAVKLKAASASTNPVDWTAASGLLMCVRSLSRFLDRMEIRASSIEPCLVLIGRTADESLVAYSSDEPITLVTISNESAIQDVLATTDKEELARKAGAHLSFAIQPEITQPSSAEQSLSGRTS